MVGCNTGDAAAAVTPTPAADTQPNEETATDTAVAESATFPLTIEHKFGSTTIPAPPERVVVIGYNDQDAVVALGVTPLAVRYWFGDTEDAIFPWADDDLVGENPAVLNMPFGELNYELILSFNPDLIIGVYSGITAEEYELLTQIAPTLAQTADYNDYGMPWQEATALIGAALGKTAVAAEVIAGVEASFAQARAAHPEFEGKSFVVAAGRGSSGNYAIFSTQDARTRYFTNLGFAPPTDLDELTGDSFYAELSQERVDLLDRDLIIFTQASYLENGADSILSDPLLAQLNAMKEGRYVILTEELDGAFSFSSVLSLPYVTEQLAPQLAAALGGGDTAVSSDTADTRTLTDALGREVTIPANPQRVVALSEIDLDSLVALGIIPVGAPNGRGQTTLPTYLLPQIEGKTTSIGPLGEPDFETILTLEPDLIVYSDPYGPLAEMIPELEQIAPVVVPYVDTGDWHWKSVLLAIAEAMGKAAEAEEWMATYDAQTAVLGAQLSADLRQVSIVRWMADGPRILLANAFSSQVLSDIGFERPAYQLDLAGTHPVHTDVISMEQVDLVDADIIFAGGLNPEGDVAMQEALENPLVQTLSAVQNNRLFTVDGLAWSSTGGPMAAMQVLADVAEALGTETAVAESTTFPVTIEHKFGSTTIPAAPERVITIGYSEQDPVLALGVVPIAVRDWFGDQPYGVWPWGQDALGSATPELLQMPHGELNFELIASLDPDLLVATHSGITEEEYNMLSQIAPTLAQPGEYPDFGVPWQIQTQLIGRALGREELANELVAAVETQIAAANEANDGFGGATVAWVTPAEEAGQYWVVGENTPPLRFLTGLGLTYDPAISEVVGDLDSAQISSERLDLLDVDVLIVRADTPGELAAILDDPLFSQLAVVQDGRVIPFVGNDPVYGALSFSTVLSLPYALDALVEQIGTAVK
ncbi:MAG: hypothetical protein BroJett015_07150 [Chloroflexota bacterium]|nr:MAG: hypothetical protein BroJett015_07150 [Chloroflexota bacterium]